MWSDPASEAIIQAFVMKYTGKKIETGTTIWSVIAMIVEAIEAKK